MNTAQNPAFGIGKLLSSPTFHAVLGVLVLLAVCWLAIYVMSRLRGSNTQGVPIDDLVRKNFEEMRSGGYISDAEFRNITSLLEGKSRRLSFPIENPTSISNVEDSEKKSN